jgi:hypothetical protein
MEEKMFALERPTMDNVLAQFQHGLAAWLSSSSLSSACIDWLTGIKHRCTELIGTTPAERGAVKRALAELSRLCQERVGHDDDTSLANVKCASQQWLVRAVLAIWFVDWSRRTLVAIPPPIYREGLIPQLGCSEQTLCKALASLYSGSDDVDVDDKNFLQFPFKRFYLPPSLELFANLRRHRIKRTGAKFEIPNVKFLSGSFFDFRYCGNDWFSIVHGRDDYDRMDVLVDTTCQEEQRLKAKRCDEPLSPWQHWHSEARCAATMARVVADNKALCAQTLREQLFNDVKECTQFKPSLAHGIYRLFGGARVLDISAGWGDRLAGALACDKVKRYVGFDPNRALKPGHDEVRRIAADYHRDALAAAERAADEAAALADVAQRLASDANALSKGGGGGEPARVAKLKAAAAAKTATDAKQAAARAAADAKASRPCDATVRYEPFEEAELDERTDRFELVFTSPPFFDFEVYTDLPGQSVLAYPSLDRWLVFFVFRALDKAWRHLEPLGNMAIHITDVFTTKVCEAWNLWAQWQLPAAHFQGVIASVGLAEKHRPIWIWRKLHGTLDAERPKRAAQLLREHFPSVYNVFLESRGGQIDGFVPVKLSASSESSSSAAASSSSSSSSSRKREHPEPSSGGALSDGGKSPPPLPALLFKRSAKKKKAKKRRKQ